ncbi:S8 family serine peptidase [Aliiroseovarius sp. KMU-50]|uniref:S8 family serine peptidase n=1 Tax=Aliiroseovarius salicola TaxID=3009082 RepID=A0ABT4W291_9RHOB|nr:S8 family serine peptidase [Aliiroseovarius sp. KMU-50]MDA5093873.1 S8 family serine peptidase [Aliiroseovarius sp. KMU-50]
MSISQRSILILASSIAFGFGALNDSAQAQDLTFGLLAPGGVPGPPGGGGGDGGGGDGGGSLADAVRYSWMHADVQGAWDDGYGGQGTTITFVDDFNSGYVFAGTLTDDPCLDAGTCTALHHGDWTAMQGELIAPLANIVRRDWSGGPVKLKNGFNVLNLSYGMYAAPGFASVRWNKQENSILDYAANGDAVIAKAAGNGCGAETGQTADLCGSTTGKLDYLAWDLIGTEGTIFVGALTDHGSGTLAYYSNIAGDNTTVQNQFLVAGVDSSDMGFAGTSFAAPQVAGYAAILSSKFTSATPGQVVDQLLGTADSSFASYEPRLHGQGEADLSMALAPDKIQ